MRLTPRAIGLFRAANVSRSFPGSHMAHIKSVSQMPRTITTMPAELVKEKFEEDGFVVFEDMYTAEDMNALQKEMAKMIDEYDVEKHASVFTTSDNQAEERSKDGYFLNSGDNISFFLEDGACDENGKLVQNKHDCINKIGHAMHELNPVFRDFSLSKKLGTALKMTGLENPVCVQSMYISKPPRIGGAVSPHQDSTFIWTDPMTCRGLWFALDDANKDNGCLWVLPGSHKQGISRRFVRTGVDYGVDFEGENTEDQWDLDKMVPVEAKKGTMIILDGACVHMSYPNYSEHQRHAYTLHSVDGTLPWDSRNWLQRTNLGGSFPKYYE